MNEIECMQKRLGTGDLIEELAVRSLGGSPLHSKINFEIFIFYAAVSAPAVYWLKTERRGKGSYIHFLNHKRPTRAPMVNSLQ